MITRYEDRVGEHKVALADCLTATDLLGQTAQVALQAAGRQPMREAVGMVSVCLRVDDVHGFTPVWLLRQLDERVWTDRPVVLGTIPFPSRGCLGERATLRETPGGSRASLANAALLDYLDERRFCGLAEIAVHGLTHADHPSPAGPAVAELMSPSAARVEWLMRALRRWRERCDSRTVIPPHNFIDSTVEAGCLGEGFHVCRAVMDHEVAALGLDPARMADRAEAKRRRPFHRAGFSVVFYQSAAVWAQRARQGGISPQVMAESIMSVVVPARVGVVTFHWWDFLLPSGAVNEEFVVFTIDLLRACERLAVVEYLTISQLAGRLVHR
ncbi:MAG: hypothetical protein WCF33_21335 [Pseudonocardiaceae bacterium]